MTKLVTNRDLYEEIQVLKKDKLKMKHQVKSQWYYIFWGTATVAVVGGQIFVGTGFARMAESLDNVLDAPIILDMGPRHRLMDPIYDDPMVIR